MSQISIPFSASGPVPPQIATQYVADSGSATPAANILNELGSGSITTTGAGNTITTALTGLTNHAILVGAGTSTIGKLAIGTNGQVLIGATGANPAFANLTSSDGSVTFTTGANTLDLSVSNAPGVDSITGTANQIAANGVTGSPQAGDVILTLSPPIQLQNGTVAAPTYSFSGNTGTGMYRGASGELGFAVNGTDWLHISLSGTTTATGLLQNTSGRIWLLETNSGTPVTLTTSSHVMLCSNTGARSVVLPSATNSGQVFVVKDSVGTATANPITVTVNGGVKTIDGALSFLIDVSWGSATFITDGTNYFVI